MTKYVYDFSEGNKDMKDLLGGKGANLAEMTNMGLPVPPGFTITTEACLISPEERGRAAGDARRRPASTWPRSRRRWAATSATRRPAAGLRALRRQVLDARHDGHGPQPRPQRGVRAGPREADRRRHAVRERRLPPVHPDVRQDRDGRPGRGVRARARRGEGAQGSRHPGHGPGHRRPRRADRAVPGDLPGAHGRGVPAGSEGPAAPGDRRGLLVVERQARDRLPAPEQDLRRPGHRGEHPGDGVRQPGRRLGDRCGVHPGPRDRREGAVRRLPLERAGRGRRRRDPQHAAHRGAGAAGPARVREAPHGHGHARRSLPRHVRHRVHDREAHVLAPADAHRQADRVRRVGDGLRHAGGGADRRRRGAAAGGREPSGGAVQAAGRRRGVRRSGHRSDRRRAQRVPRRGERQGRVQRRRGAGVGRPRRARDPRPSRDHARRLPRHDRVAGHPDERGRHELARRGRRSRRGHPGGVRSGRDQARCGREDVLGRRHHGRRGRGHHDRRLHREGLRRRGARQGIRAPGGAVGRRRGARAEDLEGVRGVDGGGRSGPAPPRPRRTPTRPTSRRTRANAAPKASASAAPSTCSWAPSGSRPCSR